MSDEKPPEEENNLQDQSATIGTIVPATNGESTQTVEIPPAAVQAIMQIAANQFYHKGPIPDAKSFERYEKTLHGAADRILKMAEKEQELRIIQAPVNEKREFIGRMIGQVSGITTLLIMLGCGTYLASGNPSTGQIAVACAFFATPVMAGIEKITTLFKK